MRTAKSKTNYEKHGSNENYNSHASHNSQQRMIATLAAEGAEMPAGIRGVV
jgi:hypothetical protein